MKIIQIKLQVLTSIEMPINIFINWFEIDLFLRYNKIGVHLHDLIKRYFYKKNQKQI